MNHITPQLADILSLLRIFEALPFPILKFYYQKAYGRKITREALRFYSSESYLFFDEKADICYQYRGSRFDLKSAYCLLVISRIIDAGEKNVSKAKYPFSYFFEHEGKLYKLIDYADSGENKLYVQKQIYESENELTNHIPVIVFLNQEYDPLFKRNMNGEYMLVPQNDYATAVVTYHSENTFEHAFNVMMLMHKGGKI